MCLTQAKFTIDAQRILVGKPGGIRTPGEGGRAVNGYEDNIKMAITLILLRN